MRGADVASLADEFSAEARSETRPGPARTVLVRLRLKWSRTLAEAVTDGGQAMKGLALLVDMSLLLALPTATTVEAWPTERWPVAIGAAGTEGFSPDTPPTAA